MLYENSATVAAEMAPNTIFRPVSVTRLVS